MVKVLCTTTAKRWLNERKKGQNNPFESTTKRKETERTKQFKNGTFVSSFLRFFYQKRFFFYKKVGLIIYLFSIQLSLDFLTLSMREKLSDNSTYPRLCERTFQPITSNHHNADHVADFYFLVLSSSMCAVFCSYSSLQKETALISRQRCRLQRLTALLFLLWTHKNEEQNTVWSKICVSFLAKDVRIFIKWGAR